MAVSTRHLHRQRLREATENETDDVHNIIARSPLGGGGGHAHGAMPNNIKKSTAVMDALSDENSELSKFLFANGEMKRLNMMQSATYSLSLEPLAIRSEKAIQSAEAITIFGALFLGGTWILYEWGSNKSYGGDDTNVVINRLFAAVMAVGELCRSMW